MKLRHRHSVGYSAAMKGANSSCIQKINESQRLYTKVFVVGYHHIQLQNRQYCGRK